MNIVKNIIKIQRIRTEQLSLKYKRQSLAELNTGLITEDMDIQVPAKLQITDRVEDGNHVYDLVLSFKSCKRIDTTGRYAYIATEASGSRRLIGDNERPYPVTLCNEVHPDNMSDSQLFDVSVTLKTAVIPRYLI